MLLDICCCFCLKVNKFVFYPNNGVSSVILGQMGDLTQSMCKYIYVYTIYVEISKIIDHFSPTRGPKARVRT